jgi:hypothetical protein
MTGARRGFGWWCRCVVHNAVIHPALPLADAMDALGFKAIPRFVYWAHDWTAPIGGG